MGPQTFPKLNRCSYWPRLRSGLRALGLGAALLVAAGTIQAQTPTSPAPAAPQEPLPVTPTDTVQQPPAGTVPLPADTIRAPTGTPPAPADTTPPVMPDSGAVPPGTAPALVDTIPVAVDDSLAIAGADTVPGDSLRPVVVVAPIRAGAEPGWAAGVWEWDRAALMRSSALTLTDLLARIPGITPIRSGFHAHPEALAGPGAAGGYTEIILDGFVLDPLNSASYDISRLELVQLERVRAERRGTGIRIELETVAPTEHEPYSLVEAGTGDYGARLFRGTFMTPDFIVGPLALGIERLEGNGFLGAEPANSFAGWFKWARGFGSTTVQLEFRRNTVEWRTQDLAATKGFRQDWVLRTRSALAPGLTTEAFLGVSRNEDENVTTLVAREEGVQGGLRAAYQYENFWTNATLRARDARTLPGLQADLALGYRLPGTMSLSAELDHADWRAGRNASSWGIHAGLERFGLVRPFIEYSSGSRGIPGLLDDAGRTRLTDRDLLRAGAEIVWRGASLGAAWNRLEADAIADFGLPFDRTESLFSGGTMQGLEINGQVPLFLPHLRLEGWYNRWSGDNYWIYLPTQNWRTALAYHHLPLPSGNLEIDARLELSHRGSMIVPELADPALGPSGGAITTVVPGITSFDFYLQIRVLDVHAFVRWNNITHQLYQQDLPGRYLPGQQAFYGIKWSFWN